MNSVSTEPRYLRALKRHRFGAVRRTLHPRIYVVLSQRNHTRYKVHWDPKAKNHTCTCPDFEEFGPGHVCGHILSVALFRQGGLTKPQDPAKQPEPIPIRAWRQGKQLLTMHRHRLDAAAKVLQVATKLTKLPPRVRKALQWPLQAGLWLQALRPPVTANVAPAEEGGIEQVRELIDHLYGPDPEPASKSPTQPPVASPVPDDPENEPHNHGWIWTDGSWEPVRYGDCRECQEARAIELDESPEHR